MFTIKTTTTYRVHYVDRRGAHCMLTSNCMSAVHMALERFAARRIAATAYVEETGEDRRVIGESWKNDGRWAWSCERAE